MKKRNINLYKYTPRTVSLQQIIPRLTGIYHDRGNIVATDGQILCAIKSTYPPEFERKIIGKKGEIIDGKYPRWRCTIPKTTKANLIDLNLEDLRERVEGGLAISKKTKQQVVIKIETPGCDVYFEGVNFKLFLDFISCYPDCKVYYSKANHPLKASNKNGDLCIVIPIDMPVIEGFQLAV